MYFILFTTGKTLRYFDFTKIRESTDITGSVYDALSKKELNMSELKKTSLIGFNLMSGLCALLYTAKL